MGETCGTRGDKEKILLGFGWKTCMKGIPLDK
jgi:hypothetical protein